MWLYIDSSQHYVIEDLCDYRGFLQGIQRVLEPDDFIVFSSYGSRSDVRALFEQHQLEPDEHVLRERERLALYRDEYPDAIAVRWSAEPGQLGQLLELLYDSADSCDLCDHIIAYGGRGALLSFHDAFKSDALIISGMVPEPVIREFCGLLGVQYRVQKREELYEHARSKDPEPLLSPGGQQTK